jgi:hypothetical protein
VQQERGADVRHAGFASVHPHECVARPAVGRAGGLFGDKAASARGAEAPAGEVWRHRKRHVGKQVEVARHGLDDERPGAAQRLRRKRLLDPLPDVVSEEVVDDDEQPREAPRGELRVRQLHRRHHPADFRRAEAAGAREPRRYVPVVVDHDVDLGERRQAERARQRVHAEV